MVNRLTPILTAALLALSLAACSNTPKDPDEEIPPEVDELLGRERPDYEGKGTLEQVFAGDDGKASEQQVALAEQAARKMQRLEQRMARLEQQLAGIAQDRAAAGGEQGAAPAPPSGRSFELGMLLTATEEGPLGNDLQRALNGVAAQAGVPFAGSGAIAERLSEAGCNDVTAPGCPGELAVYPGTRVLVLVDSIRTTGQAAVVTYRLLDTVTGTTRGPKTLRLTASNGSVPSEALRAAADEILLSSRNLADSAPWQTRAFNQRDGQWYLSAGRDAGLAVGDRLVIHGPGRTIATPGGNVAGWVAGARKGVLEITGFAGEGIAVARLVEGQAPTPQDPILAPDSSLAASGN